MNLHSKIIEGSSEDDVHRVETAQTSPTRADSFIDAIVSNLTSEGRNTRRVVEEDDDAWVDKLRAERDSFVAPRKSVVESGTPVEDLDWVDRIRAERDSYYANLQESAVVEDEAPAAVETTIEEAPETPAVEPEVIEAEPAPTPVEVLAPIIKEPARQDTKHILVEPPTVVEATGEVAPSPVRTEEQVEQMVDMIFDRLQTAWPEAPKTVSDVPPTVIREEIDLKETTYELIEALKSELPRAMQKELVAPMRGEILAAVRKEVMQVVRDEMVAGLKPLTRIIDRLGTIEARMAKIEGAVGREVKLTFPKGMVQIDAPVTVPERVVKIAAPINVQPAQVRIDKGAIQVEFVKGPKGKRQVNFDRDPYDNCVKSAEIIDVPSE